MMCLHVAQKLTLTLNREYSASPGRATNRLANSRWNCRVVRDRKLTHLISIDDPP